MSIGGMRRQQAAQEVAPFAGQRGSGSPPNAAGVSPSLADEVAYISGIDANGSIVANSYWSGYEHVSAFKFGSSTAGTGATISYAFDTTSGFTATEQATFERALATWSAVADVSFVRSATPASASILLHRGNDGLAYTDGAIAAGSGAALGHRTAQAVISIDTSVAGFDLSGSFDTVGGYGFATAIHEIGHAIGLGHGGAYNFTADPQTDQFSAYDSAGYSVMSYFSWADPYLKYGATPDQRYVYWGESPDGYQRTTSQTAMQADIMAIQALYGVARETPFSTPNVFGFHSTVAGPLASVYDFSKNQHPVITITSSAAGNTLDLSGFNATQTVVLSPGYFSDVGGLSQNLMIAPGTWIDNAIGGGSWDRIYGNDHANRIDGGGGSSDWLFGGGGDDILVAGETAHLNGGAGDDRLYLISGTAEDIADDGGFDRVFCSGATCRVGDGIEVLTFTAGVDAYGQASGAAITMYGNIGNDQLEGHWAADKLIGAGGDDELLGDSGEDQLLGGDGDDDLDGGYGNDLLNGGNGADHMEGGLGDDHFIVNSAADIVFERRSGGHDLVTASIAYTLPVEVEDLRLTGGAARASGNASANAITGTATANVLAGLGGNDVLSGMGGRDQLDGGIGNDQLIGGTGVDQLTGGAGADRFVFFAGDSGPLAGEMDRILDFSHAQHDRVDLSGLAPDVALHFVGTHAFSGVAGEVRYMFAGEQTKVGVDLNGDKVADFGFYLAAKQTLLAGDFILHA